jgi:hypothetical protein
MAVVRVNPRLEAELTGSLSSNGPMEHVLGGVADQIANEARRIARAEFYNRGGYTRGIKAEHGLNEHGEVVGRVIATDWKSHWAEWGWRGRSGGTRARHVLSRAAERVGFQVVGAGLAGGVRGRTSGRALPAPRLPAITGRR